MIERDIAGEFKQSAAQYPVITVLGPRQSGKTTLARMECPDKPWVSLEDPDVRLAAQTDPRGFLAQYSKGAILDEVQRVPELLSYLQGIVDREGGRGRYILTGSHQPALHHAISQSLAGRSAVLTLWPFSCRELRQYGPLPGAWDLIQRGFYPRVHQEQLDPVRYYSNYVQTYVERDVRAMVQVRDLAVFQKFMVLLAGRAGQLINYASLSNDVGVSPTTLRNWLSVLKASYIVFELQPFFENVGKRVIKSPKLYFADVGLAAYLLGIHSAEQLARDPLRGNLYENLVIAEILKGLHNAGRRAELYFYRDSHGVEVDLLIRSGTRITPVEIKSASTFTPVFIKGIESFASLKTGFTTPGRVLYNGDQTYTLRGVRVFNPLASGDLVSELLDS
jgi:predicted AAA+ superfamily ATPase